MVYSPDQPRRMQAAIEERETHEGACARSNRGGGHLRGISGTRPIFGCCADIKAQCDSVLNQLDRKRRVIPLKTGAQSRMTLDGQAPGLQQQSGIDWLVVVNDNLLNIGSWRCAGQGAEKHSFLHVGEPILFDNHCAAGLGVSGLKTADIRKGRHSRLAMQPWCASPGGCTDRQQNK